MGIQVWLDKWEITPADSIAYIVNKINDGLRQCPAAIAVLSSSSDGQWMKAEVATLIWSCINYRKLIIVVTIGENVQVPDLLRPYNCHKIHEIEAIGRKLLAHELDLPEPSGDVHPLLPPDSCFDLVYQLRDHLVGREQATTLQQLDKYKHDIEAAIIVLMKDDPYRALLLARYMARYWERRGLFSTGRARLEALLSLNPSIPPADRIDCLNWIALFAHRQGACKDSNMVLEESLALSRRINDRRREANAYHLLGNTAHNIGDLERACLMHWRALSIRLSVSDSRDIAISYMNIGEVARCMKRFRIAFRYLSRSADMFEEIGKKGDLAFSLCYKARLYINIGDYEAAKDYILSSTRLHHGVGYDRGLAMCLDAAAKLAVFEGDYGYAVRMLSCADHIRHVISASIAWHDLEQRNEVMAALASYDDRNYAAAWTEGQLIEPDDASRYLAQWLTKNGDDIADNALS